MMMTYPKAQEVWQYSKEEQAREAAAKEAIIIPSSPCLSFG